jgi:hypothetical protein
VENSGGGDAAAHGPADGVVDGADVVEGAQVGADLMGEARVADHDEAQRIASQAHEVAEHRQGAGGGRDGRRGLLPRARRPESSTNH